MAYGDKYEFSFYSHRRNDYYTVTLAQDDYTGSKTTLDYADVVPCTINWFGDENDVFKPVVGSECVIRFVSETSYQYQDFFYVNDREYRVTVTKNGDTYWQGFVIPGIYNEEYSASMYTIEISATDGLGDLYNQPFVDTTDSLPFTGTDTIANYLKICLNDYTGLSLGLKENLDIYHSTHTSTSTDSFLLQTNLSGHAFKGYSCGQFVEDVARSLGCRVYQLDGYWHFKKINLLNESYYTERTYNTSFASPAATLFNPLLVFDNPDTSPDGFPVFNTGDVTINPGITKVNMTHNYGEAETVLVGDNFGEDDFADTDEVDRWISDYSGSPALWTGFSNWAGKATVDTTFNANDGLPVLKINGDGDETFIISAMANHASGTQITCTGHGYSNGDYILIWDDEEDKDFLKDYSGWYTISNTATNTFVISATYTSDRSGAGTYARHYQNCEIIQYNGSLPLGADSTINRQDGDYIEIKIEYYIIRQNLPVQSDDKQAHLQLVLGLENQDGGSDLYATNIGGLGLPKRGALSEYAYIKEFDAFFTDGEKSIIYPTSNVESGVLEEITIKVALNIDSTDTYIPYLAIAEGYGNDYDLGTNGVRVRSITMAIKSEYSGPGLLEKETGFSNLNAERDTEIRIGAVDKDVNLEWKAKRIFLSTADVPLDNTATDFTDTFTTNTFDEILFWPYKKMLGSSALRLRLTAEQDGQDIDIHNSIRDTNTFGHKFMIVEASKNLRDDLVELALVQLNPQEDITEEISGGARFVWEPNYFEGSPASINTFRQLVNRTWAERIAIESGGDTRTLLTDANGVPYVQQPPAGDQYEQPNTEGSLTQEYTVVYALRVTETVAADRAILAGNDGTTTTGLIKVNNGDIYVDSGTSVDTTRNATEDVLEVWAYIADGASSEFYQDSTSGGAISAGTEPMLGFVLMGDNSTSNISSLGHDWYGAYYWDKELTAQEISDITDKIRAKTQADRIRIASLEVTSSTPGVIDVTFDKSVTGFNTTGLSLRFRNGTTRTISSIAGSGTDWTITMSGSASLGDLIDLEIDAINGATNSAGDIIYPGVYPVDNLITAFEEWDLSSYSSLVEDYSPYAVSTTGSDIDNFTGTTTNAVSAGVDKLQVSTDSFGYRYCQITRGDDQGYTASFGTIAQAYSVFYILELDSTDSTSVGYLMDSIASGGRASVWRNLGLTKLFAGTTYNSAMTAQEDQVITIGYVADGSSSSVYLNGSPTDSEINIGTNSMGTGMTLFDRYTLASLSATFKFYRVAVFDTDIGSVGMADLHTKAKNMYNGAITV